VTAALAVLLAVGAWVFLVLMVLTLCAAAAGRSRRPGAARGLGGASERPAAQRIRSREASAA